MTERAGTGGRRSEPRRPEPWRVDPASPDFEVERPGPSVSAPVVVHVPHASLAIPDDVRAGIVLDDAALARELARITDHRTDVLSADATSFGATRVVNRRSRLVVDPERFPDPAQESMERRGMGAVYSATTDRERLRDDDADRRAVLLERYFTPYAAAVAEVVAGHLEVHGRCHIVDVHSYPSRRLPYEIGGDGRPEVCLGTDPFHTPAWLRDVVVDAASRAGLQVGFDEPFAGVYVPLDRYGTDPRVSAVMIEIRRDLYLDEATATPHTGETRIRAFVADVVRACARR